MEIIQASGSCSSPAWKTHLFSHASTRIGSYSRAFRSSILSVKPKISTRDKLISTSTRAIIQNSTSDSVVTKAVGDNRSLAQLISFQRMAAEIAPDLKGTSIFLIAPTKSSLGKILADALRYYYFDSDSLVEEAAGGKAVAISLLESDEEGYLASETEVLKQLSSMGRLVVSAGNGAVKSVTNLGLLRHGISIWIDVPLDLVAGEIKDDKTQLSASDTSICNSFSEVMDQLAALYESAQSGYSTVDSTISLQKVASALGYDYDELNSVTTEDLCLEVLKEIEKLTRVKKMMEEAARPF